MGQQEIISLKFMSKVEKRFVKSNLIELKNKSFKNAERLFKDAKILRSKQSFCSSLFLLITALEELTKYHLLKQNNIDFSQVDKITNHNFKVSKMLEIFKEISSNPRLKKEDSVWLKDNRIKEMREDGLYVRLSSRRKDKNYPLFPNEEYWQKRAKAMIILLEAIFKYFYSKRTNYRIDVR